MILNKWIRVLLLAALVLATIPARATVFATLRGVIHDGGHHPLAHVTVSLTASDSTFVRTTETAADGSFALAEAPAGVYRLHVEKVGFAAIDEALTLASGTSPVVHLMLQVAGQREQIEVNAQANDSATPTTIVTRVEIEQTPGASRTLGMEMITDYVPGAYMTHDMLHMRGGHQTSWLIDGISIPNTKIAANVGPQIDPKDIETLEVLRGSYAAELGDRTYGVFDVVPRNGFERTRAGEFSVTGGNFATGESQLSLGDHSATTAWYASLTGSRSDYGLSTPVASVRHDRTNSESAFASVLANRGAHDQLRLTGQMRSDYFEVPYDPDPNDWEQQSQYYESYGLRDGQTERDAMLIANWVHTANPHQTWSVAPFYHYNLSDYDSATSDDPAATTWHQRSHYGGVQADLRQTAGAHGLSAGLYSFVQQESDLYGVTADGTRYGPTSTGVAAGLVELSLGDHWRLNRYINLIGGERFSIYRAGLNETAIYPRLGATVLVPRLSWVLRGFYGHYFQPAPVETVSAAVLNYAGTLGGGENQFTALPSERDEEYQFGVTIPWRGWTADIDTVHTRIRNFLDHSNLGASNMYFPIGVDGALVRSWELSLRSPLLARRGQLHLVYSNQIAEQRGNIIGGFTCSFADDPACNTDFSYTPVDHDQRHTLNAGFNLQLPARSWVGANIYYGSGFTNGLAGSGSGPYQGAYLPVHTTADLAAGHTFGEHWTISATAVNLTNHRVLLDNSVTVGGFHWNDPRLLSAGVRYRFHF